MILRKYLLVAGHSVRVEYNGLRKLYRPINALDTTEEAEQCFSSSDLRLSSI